MGGSVGTVAGAAARLLASSYTLYLKTHNFHWNVRGPMFSALHLMFETQYQEMALAVDEIAERIRALGEHAPGSYAEFVELSAVRDASKRHSADEMLRVLLEDQGKVVQSAKELFAASEKAGDQASADLAVRRIQVHEKNAWMLRSHLE